MTTDVERRVPDMPDWKPWYVRYAEIDGRALVLADIAVSRAACPCVTVEAKRYAVRCRPSVPDHLCPHGIGSWWISPDQYRYVGDSLEDAERVFAFEEARLLSGADRQILGRDA